jgi:hypothetical protein
MKIRNALLVAAVSTLVTGCMTWGGFQERLGGLIGEPIDTAIDHWGYPNGERTIAGHHIYVWASNSTGVITLPQTTYGTATAFSKYGTATAYGTSTTYVPMAVNYGCQIELEVDMENRITRYSYHGNRGGCMQYYRQLPES